MYDDRTINGGGSIGGGGGDRGGRGSGRHKMEFNGSIFFTLLSVREGEED